MKIIEDGKWTEEATDMIVHFAEQIDQRHETFGQRLRQMRKAAGLSLRELAQQVDLDFTYLSKLENDRLPAPSLRAIRRLAIALNANYVEWVELSGKMVSARKHGELEVELRVTRARLEVARAEAEHWKECYTGLEVRYNELKEMLQ
ncbi:MAG: helix-turn-helix domain-containing protein [Chloroflexi bacterium]|nr:helix-turn-helix domain-containing protein [Chloroflexota bacterium]